MGHMSMQDVQRVDEQGIAAWDSHNADAFVALFAENFVWRDSAMPEPIRTKDQAREYFQGWMTAFPDMHIKGINRVVSEDQVATELEFTGTNQGPMRMGGNEMPATGKKVTGHGTYFARIKDGKIVEFSSHPDVADMLMQLGMMPQM
jgi:steroid delta-isomerase-like uncharacterized protein